MIKKFAGLYFEEIPKMDVCGWFPYPRSGCHLVKTARWYSWKVCIPSSRNIEVFEEKRVLAVHPFKETTLYQYDNN